MLQSMGCQFGTRDPHLELWDERPEAHAVTMIRLLDSPIQLGKEQRKNHGGKAKPTHNLSQRRQFDMSACTARLGSTKRLSCLAVKMDSGLHRPKETNIRTTVRLLD